MSSASASFVSQLALLQSKEKAISSTMPMPSIRGLHILLTAALTDLSRQMPALDLSGLTRLLRPAGFPNFQEVALKDGIEDLVYNKATPKAARLKLGMYLDQAFGQEQETAYAYLGLWMDAYLSLLFLVVQTIQVFRRDPDRLRKHNSLTPRAAQMLVTLHALLHAKTPERLVQFLQGPTPALPLSVDKLLDLKAQYDSLMEYLAEHLKITRRQQVR